MRGRRGVRCERCGRRLKRRGRKRTMTSLLATRPAFLPLPSWERAGERGLRSAIFAAPRTNGSRTWQFQLGAFALITFSYRSNSNAAASTDPHPAFSPTGTTFAPFSGYAGTTKGRERKACQTPKQSGRARSRRESIPTKKSASQREAPQNTETRGTYCPRIRPANRGAPFPMCGNLILPIAEMRSSARRSAALYVGTFSVLEISKMRPRL
jgi:hypothetical protein